MLSVELILKWSVTARKVKVEERAFKHVRKRREREGGEEEV